MENAKFKAQFNRIVFIDKKIREGSYPNARSLAEEYEGISPRTIKRDIEWLRDFQNAPIEYDYEKKRYYYAEENYLLPVVHLSAGELFSMAITEQVLSEYRNTPLYHSLKQIFDRILSFIPDKATVAPYRLSTKFSIFSQPGVQIERTIWDSVMKALEENRVIQFEYTVPGYEKGVLRTLRPYHSICHKGQWYLLGFEEVKKDIRIFALNRMSDINVLAKTFSIPEDFSPGQYIDSHFGVFINKQIHTVRLLIAPEVKDYFTERIWHEKQSMKLFENGSLELTFPTNQLEEVISG